MHRTFFLARWIGCSSLLLALILHVGIFSGSAQNPTQPTKMLHSHSIRDHAPVIEMGVGMSRAHAMSSRAHLKRVENPNSSIVRVEKVPDSSTEVTLVAVNPGRTTVTFTDQNDRVEQHDFVVASGPIAPVAAAPAALAPSVQAIPAQPKEDSVVMIYMKPNENKTLPSQLLAQPDAKVEILNSDDRVVILTFPPKVPPVLTARLPGIATITVKGVKLTEVFEVIVTAPVDDLQKTINRLVPTGAITVVADEKTNTRVVTGTVLTADDARLVKQISDQAGAISSIKIGGVQQVQLEVLIAVVNRSEARNMSFSFAQNGTNWFISSLFGGPFSAGSALATGIASSTAAITPVPTAANIPFGILNNNHSFIGFLQCLRTENLAKIIAEPRVTTLSGRPAFIVSGGETPLLTSSGLGAPSVTYKQFGTVVNFLPIVLGNGKIHLEVRPELSDIDNTLGISIPGVTPTIIPGFRTRSAQVAVQIDDGQTLAIGGLIQNTVNATIDRVPVLGDLPGLGTLFSRKSYVENEQELIILVTPRLVDGVDCTKIPKYLPGRETRSPDDFELFLEGILEAPRGPRNVKFHPHEYKPAFHGASNINQIPCGDGNQYGRVGTYGSSGAGQSIGMSSLPNRTPFTQTNPSFQNEFKAIPASYPRQEGERETPTLPPLREPIPTFGPTAPAREFDNLRPELPPAMPNFPR